MTKPLNIRRVPPGQVVAAEFSPVEIAPACGVSRSTIWRWSQPRPKGTGGVVPSEYHVPLLQLARELGRTLTPGDLVLGRDR